MRFAGVLRRRRCNPPRMHSNSAVGASVRRPRHHSRTPLTCPPSRARHRPSASAPVSAPLADLGGASLGYGVPDPLWTLFPSLSRTSAPVWSDIALQSISLSASQSLKIGISGLLLVVSALCRSAGILGGFGFWNPFWRFFVLGIQAFEFKMRQCFCDEVCEMERIKRTCLFMSSP